MVQALVLTRFLRIPRAGDLHLVPPQGPPATLAVHASPPPSCDPTLLIKQITYTTDIPANKERPVCALGPIIPIFPVSLLHRKQVFLRGANSRASLSYQLEATAVGLEAQVSVGYVCMCVVLPSSVSGRQAEATCSSRSPFYVSSCREFVVDHRPWLLLCASSVVTGGVMLRPHTLYDSRDSACSWTR